MNTELFIRKAKEIHGNKYDYSKVEYINSNTPITLICKKHDEFTQRPAKHLYAKQGCKICGNERNGINRRANTQQFIKNAQDKHGNKYDYTKVKYITNTEEVIIICKQHSHEYKQKPINHLTGAGGCIICVELKRGSTQRCSTSSFIEKAKLIHGNKYNYSRVEYVNSNIPIIIICEKHKEFTQRPNDHLDGHGCRKCYDEINGINKAYNTFEFIQKAQEIHGNKYNYSKVEYINFNTPIIIICEKHKDFSQKPVNHLQGNGCIKCAGNYQYTTYEFIEKAQEIHGNKYNYSKVEYINFVTPIIIICEKHKDFSQKPVNHLQGSGCIKCRNDATGNRLRSNTDDFIQRAKNIHIDKYDYSKVEYNSSNENIIILCKKHGEFLQTPSNHINAQHGCPLCVNKTESKLYEKIKPIYQTLITQFKQEWCKKKIHLPYDFCIPEYKIIIELDGRQHFEQVLNWSSPEEQFKNDKYKEECANNNGYSVIRLLQEDVFYDTYDWTKKLCDSVEEIKKGEDITNIYLCKNNEYDKF